VRERAGLPGRGRNIAAAHAAHDWLAFIDAGIRPAPDWLEELIARAESTPAVEVVYGGWEPVTDSFFKECAAIAYVPPPAEVKEAAGGLMRPRSIASSLMRREVWRRAGGFPEHLRSAEDLLFMNEVERTGALTVYAPRAVVRWDIQPTLWRTFRRFVAYSRHNIRAGLWRDWQRTIVRRYALLLCAALPILYFGWRWLAVVCALWLAMLAARAVTALRRQRRAFPAGLGRNLLRLCLLVPLLAALDAAALAGTLNWLFLDRLRLRGPEAAEGAR
jgi:cellulose synthase/poly-beta-1,6-N-acetylglucosamine synthase-like glycosyltransferase